MLEIIEFIFEVLAATSTSSLKPAIKIIIFFTFILLIINDYRNQKSPPNMQIERTQII